MAREYSYQRSDALKDRQARGVSKYGKSRSCGITGRAELCTQASAGFDHRARADGDCIKVEAVAWARFCVPSTVGMPMLNSNVTTKLKGILKGFKMPHKRMFHSLRHMTASLLLAEAADLFAVKEHLGQSQITLTVGTHGHLTKRLSETITAQLSGAVLDTTEKKGAPISNSDTIALVSRQEAVGD